MRPSTSTKRTSASPRLHAGTPNGFREPAEGRSGSKAESPFPFGGREATSSRAWSRRSAEASFHSGSGVWTGAARISRTPAARSSATERPSAPTFPESTVARTTRRSARRRGRLRARRRRRERSAAPVPAPRRSCAAPRPSQESSIVTPAASRNAAVSSSRRRPFVTTCTSGARPGRADAARSASALRTSAFARSGSPPKRTSFGRAWPDVATRRTAASRAAASISRGAPRRCGQ